MLSGLVSSHHIDSETNNQITTKMKTTSIIHTSAKGSLWKTLLALRNVHLAIAGNTASEVRTMMHRQCRLFRMDSVVTTERHLSRMMRKAA